VTMTRTAPGRKRAAPEKLPTRNGPDRRRRLAEGYRRAYRTPLRPLRKLYPALWHAARHSGLTAEEIESAAWLGVMRAAALFDPTRGATFCTYANQWLRGKVGDAVRERVRLTALPTVGPDGWGDPEDAWGWELLPAREDPPPPDGPDDALRRALAALPPADRLAVAGRFGLDGTDPLTFAEVGAMLGVSKERGRQLCVRGLDKLRELLAGGCGA
jgi:DNA-directed RNA polymerase specialized sigma24 family protein